MKPTYQEVNRLRDFLSELAAVVSSDKDFRVETQTSDGEWLGYPLGGPFCPERNYRIVATPRERWMNVYPLGFDRVHPTKEHADLHCYSDRTECIHFREVLV